MIGSQQVEHGIGSAEHTRAVPRKRAAASVVFTDGTGRVLICEPTYKEVWEVPGGAVEENESPRDAAAREVKEELGLIIEPGNLAVIDWVPPISGRTEGLICVFDGGRLTQEQSASITLDATELRSWSWSTMVEVRQRMRPLVARRVEAAMKAIKTRTTMYLEAGYPIGEKPTE